MFQALVEAFPESGNGYDSLTEAYLHAGERAKAKANYRLSLAKDPKNDNARAILADFDTHAQRFEDERRITLLPGQATGLRGPYLGQTPPGRVPRLFAPGIVNRLDEAIAYACSFSPDGAEFYFTRGGNPQAILVSRLTPAGWTFPEPTTFSRGFGAHEPHVTFDNQHVFWGWFRPSPDGVKGPGGGHYGNWAADRTPAGWSEAHYVGQGMAVTSTRDGQIYVTDHSAFPDGYLAKARLANGRFAGLERLQAGMESLRPGVARNLAHSAIAPDSSFRVFDIKGGRHLYVCFCQGDGSWGDAST